MWGVFMAEISMSNYVKNKHDKMKAESKLKNETMYVEEECKAQDPLVPESKS